MQRKRKDDAHQWIGQVAARPHAQRDGQSRRTRRIARLVTLVSRRGETHVDAIGMKAVGGTEPMQRDTIFRVVSLTKLGFGLTKSLMKVEPDPYKTAAYLVAEAIRQHLDHVH